MAEQIDPEGRVDVEVMDLADARELAEQRNFRMVEILDSGWIRCVDNVELVGDEDVDYYPPERVSGIFTTESQAGEG